jgi:hypothetical protein
LKIEMRTFWRRRAFALLVAFGVMLLLAGGSYALSAHTHSSGKGPTVEASESPEASDSPEPSESPDAGGTHGGSVERFHDAGVCNLTDVSKLDGNWTHGDYVSAVAAADPTKVTDAAQSDCGKPTKSVHTDSEAHGKSAETHGNAGTHADHESTEGADHEAPQAH